MLKRSSPALIALFAVSLFSGAVNADGPYLAVEGSSMVVDDIDSDELNPIGGRLRLGVQLTELVGVEGQAGRAVDDDNAFGDKTTLTTQGAYLKIRLPLNHNSALVGTAGYARIEAEVSSAPLGIKASRSHEGLGWGVGLETRLTDSVDLTADYLRFEVDEEDGDTFPSVASINAGIKINF